MAAPIRTAFLGLLLPVQWDAVSDSERCSSSTTGKVSETSGSDGDTATAQVCRTLGAGNSIIGGSDPKPKMKRGRHNIPTGASLFRELKLKRQRLSMLLNRDINDVLSSTGSNDAGDFGSPLMLREDSACFESRRHDAIDSGASNDGYSSFCGGSHTTRHPQMLIPIIDHTPLVTSTQPSASFTGQIASDDQSIFASGKPWLEAESHPKNTSCSPHVMHFRQPSSSSNSPQGIDFLNCLPVEGINVSRTIVASQGVDVCQQIATVTSAAMSTTIVPLSLSPPHGMASATKHGSYAEMERNLETRFSPSTSIWHHHDMRRDTEIGGLHTTAPGLPYPRNLVNDGADLGSVAKVIDILPPAMCGDKTSGHSPRAYLYPIHEKEARAPLSLPMHSGIPSDTDEIQSCVHTSRPYSTGQANGESARQPEKRSVIRHGTDLVVSVKLDDATNDSPAPATVLPISSNKAVLNWTQLEKLKQTQETGYNPAKKDSSDAEKEQLGCEICDDRASGLHYGIISCEGCKGFFKRTVQNKRVYSCIADGDCQVTKLRRNRCQYCRFKKCLLKGMVLAAVRDDRMPGGRNSRAVYNLYKVKYRKTGRTADNVARRAPASRHPKPVQCVSGIRKKPQPRVVPSSSQSVAPRWQQLKPQGINETIHVDEGSMCHLEQSTAFQCPIIDCVRHDRTANAGSPMAPHDQLMNIDSSSPSLDGNVHFTTASRNPSVDNPIVSHYLTADSPTTARRDMYDDNSTLSHFLSVDSPTVSHDQTVDNRLVSQGHYADSSPGVNVVSSCARYSDCCDVNHSRRTVIADSRDSNDGISKTNYETLNMNDGISKTDFEILNVNADRRNTNYEILNINRSKTNLNYETIDLNKNITNSNCIGTSMTEDIMRVNYERLKRNNDRCKMKRGGVDMNANANCDRATSNRHSSHVVHVKQLLHCERAHDLAAATRPYSGASLVTLLGHLSDNVVRELVKWMKTLPFYDLLPVSVHKQYLAEKWYDILLLTMLAHQACATDPQGGDTDDVSGYVARNVRRLQNGLRHVLEREMPVDELYREVGDIVQKLTDIVINFRQLGLTREEYVCLKVILLLNHERRTNANDRAEQIMSTYRGVLQQLVADTFPHQPNRCAELLSLLPHIQTASALLMETNTIYIPSMLNAPLHEQ